MYIHKCYTNIRQLYHMTYMTCISIYIYIHIMMSFTSGNQTWLGRTFRSEFDH